MIEVGHHAVDQLAATQIAGIQALRQEAKQIACLLDCFRPIGGRCGGQQVFEFRLSRAQRFLIGFDLGPQTPKVRCLLGCHTAMNIEIGWLISHLLFLRVRYPRVPDGPMT